MNDPRDNTEHASGSAWPSGARVRRQAGSKIGLAFVALALLSLPASHAAAFNQYETFRDETTDGGGGGRFFTGSPRDGFTCAVCHVSDRAMEAPAFVFADETLTLLEDGYVPGQTYDIILELQFQDGETDSSAGVIEITDGAGNPAGILIVPDDDVDVCGLDIDGDVQPPVHLLGGDDGLGEDQGRQVAVSDSCGEQRVFVQWTAPEMATNGIVLYAAAVSGDGDAFSRPEPGDEDHEGDWVQVAAIQLPVAGEAPEVMRVGTSCGVAHGRGGAGWPLLLGMGAVCLWRRSRP